MFVGPISFNVTNEFGAPIVYPGFWNAGIGTACVLMPEASAHFDDFLQAAKNEIGLARKMGNVQSIPEAHAVDEFADDHFGRGVLRTDFPHVLGAVFEGELIGHTARSSGRSEYP